MDNCFSISIYDTTQPPDLGEPLEHASAGSLTLTYDGGDEKLLPIMAGSLGFTMEVNVAEPDTDAFFGHLFTGDETRYQVVLRNEEQERVVWRGHLLPEQYRESYTRNTFYVSFTATDGLGRLEGRRLSLPLYRGRSSIIHIIVQCLTETGLEFPVYVNKAIKNEGDWKWHEQFIDMRPFLSDDDGRASCYEILESLLTTLGCTLYSRHDTWYITAATAETQSSREYDIYDSEGTYQDTQNIARSARLIRRMYDVPEVMISPPWKTVKVKSEAQEDDSILPEDVVHQVTVIRQHEQKLNHPKYWYPIPTLDAKHSFQLVPEDLIDLDEDGEADVDGYIGIHSSGSGSPSFLQNWIEMEVYQRPHVRAGQRLDIELEVFIFWAYAALSTQDPETNFINKYVHYAIFINNNMLLSNFSPATGVKKVYFRQNDDIVNRGDPDVSGLNYLRIGGKVRIENWQAPITGRLNIRLYATGDLNVSNAQTYHNTALKSLTITLRDPIASLVDRTRTINFSPVKDIDSAVADSTVYNRRYNIIISDTDPADLTEKIFSIIPTDSTLVDANKVSVAGYIIPFDANISLPRLFLKRWMTDYYEKVPSVQFAFTSGQLVLRLDFTDNYVPGPGDKLYEAPPATDDDPQSVLWVYRDRWEKANYSNGIKRYNECLAELTHDVNAKALSVFEGEADSLPDTSLGAEKNIWFPMDRVLWKYRGSFLFWQPIRIENRLDQGKVQCTFMEAEPENVTDYE